MKLLLCTNCQDVIRMVREEKRTCRCGKTKGKYINSINATYSGEYAIPIGFNNISLIEAINKQPDDGSGFRFEAFVIPKDCPTFKKK